MPRLALLAVLLFASVVRADTATLPRYDLRINIDTKAHRVDVLQSITWTNRAKTPTAELRLNFYPHYRIPDGDYLLLAKTLELLRLNPRDGIDRHGRAGTICSVHQNGVPLEYAYENDNPSAFTIRLPKLVWPGESVSIDVECRILLPNKQGRWGHWHGIHFLTNALPVVAYYDDRGWHAMPFVPWHQPWWNEAGHYTATMTLPSAEKLACSAQVNCTTDNGDGTKTIKTEPFLGRDFAILCSPDYQETVRTVTLKSGKDVTLRCLALTKHNWYANKLLQFVAEAMPVYSEWFGDYPYEQFTIAESYFGWNGNECSGLILIDERVFASPHYAANYVEYLVSHETCHQWWYNVIGTNGYAETFMDEGAATYFTHRFLDRKHGDRNNPFMNWPRGLRWLPNINRENYRYASLYSAIGKNELPSAIGELPSYKHLIGLFNGAYDRGSKVLAMIESRLGEDAFMDFTKEIAEKYQWQILQVHNYQTELERYTGLKWDEFFENWVRGNKTTDWKIESSSIIREATQSRTDTFLATHPTGQARVLVRVRQVGEIPEPTHIGFQRKDGSWLPERILIVPGMPENQNHTNATQMTSLPDGSIEIVAHVDAAVDRVVIDPDRVLLDSNPGNNVSKSWPRWSFTPVYTMLNETDLTNDYDRWNIGGGPWIGGALYPDPWFVRSTMIGARAGAFRTQQFAGGIYGAYRTDYRDIVIGADGLLDHWPHPKMQLGFLAERRVAGPFDNNDGSDTATRGAAFLRYVFDYSPSLYLPPMHYLEVFTTYQDNFLPIARTQTPGSIRSDWSYLAGIHHRLNLYTPYWDPESGLWTDFTYAGGVAELDRRLGMNQLRYELAGVRKFPDWCCLGRLSETRLAMRGVAMGALPNEGQFFALGGGTLFRGFDLAERQGSALWVANVELRLPLVRNVEWDILDHTAGARNLWLAAFYDVGAIYTDGACVGNVAHAFGVGLRIDTAFFSFIERATLRFDAAKTINAPTPFQFWFGVQHAF